MTVGYHNFSEAPEILNMLETSTKKAGPFLTLPFIINQFLKLLQIHSGQIPISTISPGLGDSKSPPSPIEYSQSMVSSWSISIFTVYS
jgi:hypothetical protein